MERRKFLETALGLGVAAPLLPLMSAVVPMNAEQLPKGETAMSPAPERNPRLRIFITGSASGLGHLAAEALLAEGHEVVVHVRSAARQSAVADLLAQGARVTIGDLSDMAQTRRLAEDLNGIGRMDGVIHNAGVISGASLLPVNVVAPYLLTALMQRPKRLIYLSSNMHRGGKAELAGLDWSGQRVTASYSDSKLFITAFARAVARLWPDVLSNAVDPGWVPTRMGGPNAPDDLRLGHLTQEWLATSNDPEALKSGYYWHHQRIVAPIQASGDVDFQNRLIAELARFTGTALPS